MTTALIDGDILRYEIGYAAETGWKSIVGEEGLEDAPLPPFDYVASLLQMRIEHIQYTVGADDFILYLTEGDCFRNYIAKNKPYKGQRVDKKPFHHKNITAHMKAVYPTETVTWIEADDAMAIRQTISNNTCHCGGDVRKPTQSYPCTVGCQALEDTIICTRDKDLRQVPGLFFSWELGNQPQIGPLHVDSLGSLTYEKGKVFGTGFKWFCAQVFMGDAADNIPGLNKYGPVKAFGILNEAESKAECTDLLIREYKAVHGEDWEQQLLEQGQLLWIVRELDSEGKPVLWQIGMS